MRTIKVYFTDFWPGLEKYNFFLNFLQKHYTVVVDPNPDFLFFSVYGQNHLKYRDCVKICFTGENSVPDFNVCDFAMGFHYLSFGDRYLRFPLYVLYPKFASLKNREGVDASALLGRKFCNFVYSNYTNADPIRDRFFHLLNKYKKVDSGGRHLNNLGYAVADKMEFIKDYKFSISFENSAVPGYTTEKIMEPLVVHSVPIYWGNPLVGLDFNEDSFVNVMRFSTIEEGIEKIIQLDKNDEEYLKVLSQPCFKESHAIQWEELLFAFFANIFDGPPEGAKRIPAYGFSKFELEEKRLQAELLLKRKKAIQRKSSILKKIMIWKR